MFVFNIRYNDKQLQSRRCYCQNRYKKFDILPSAPALAAAEIELIDVNKREYVLKNALNALSGKYDYILIDCPPSLNLITINALVSSDSVIVPLQSEFLALEGLTDLIKI